MTRNLEIMKPNSSSQGQRIVHCLIVRPAKSKAEHAGDEIVYGRSIEYLSKSMQVDVCELEPIGRVRQLFEIAKGAPPETTRYLGEENWKRVYRAIEDTRPDVVCFFNEVTFPFLTVAKSAGIRSVLAAHNVHSVVAATDRDIRTRVFKPLAVQFERKWYDDEAAELVCISNLDVEGLRKAGIRRERIFVAPPGCPAPVTLCESAMLVPEIILTGSYGWWRKRRDLKRFALGAPLPTKIIAFDETARLILGSQAAQPQSTSSNWETCIRFGLITDSFLGGFKLKALEYVAKNCIVLSACDISLEFAGLPHADEFIRKISGKNDVWRTIEQASRSPDLIERFREFKIACTGKFNWEHCLLPLRDAVEVALYDHEGLRAIERGAAP